MTDTQQAAAFIIATLLGCALLAVILLDKIGDL